MHHDYRTTQQLTRLRELEALRPGTVVMATSSPRPRYFRRVLGGWAACDPYGRTGLQRLLSRELEGWPPVLPSKDLRRPVAVVALPEDLPLEVRAHELADELEDEFDLDGIFRMPSLAWWAA